MKVTAPVIVVVFAVFSTLAHGKCLPRQDQSAECRYSAGDAWCAENTPGNPYAYNDHCLKKPANPATSASQTLPIKQGMPYLKARKLLLDAGWQTVNMHVTPTARHNAILTTTIANIPKLPLAAVPEWAIATCGFMMATADSLMWLLSAEIPQTIQLTHGILNAKNLRPKCMNPANERNANVLIRMNA